MQCPKCNSMNVTVQAMTATKLVDKHHGIIWWIFVGWWWLPLKWLVFTVPALLWKIFKGKKQTIKQTNYSRAVCQSCGFSWNI